MTKPETRALIEAMPDNFMRQVLIYFLKCGREIRRVKKGKKGVWQVLLPDTGGWYEIFEFRSSSELMNWGNLSRLHAEIVGGPNPFEVAAAQALADIQAYPTLRASSLKYPTA